MRDRTERYGHPVITMGGIMPGGSEMVEWYTHVPFPSPAALEIKRDELLTAIEQRKAEKELAAQKALPTAGR